MTAQHHKSQVERVRREIDQLQRQVERESRQEADIARRLANARRSLASFNSPASRHSKEQEVQRLDQQLLKLQESRANLQARVAQKNSELIRYETDLSRATDRERDQLERRRKAEQERRERDLSAQLAKMKAALPNSNSELPVARILDREYDVFISHATEDKEEFVRPLADELKSLGLEVWYDDFVLKVGDSLRRSIDMGLARSRFGVVVLSSSFFAKNWPQYELDGLVAREMEGRKVILPIWHKVTKDEVLAHSPTLADKVALNSSLQSIQEIAAEISGVAKGGS